MATFQKIVLIVAIVILLLTLIIIGISLSKAKSSMTWPPIVPDCPDYWVAKGVYDLSASDVSGSSLSTGGPYCVNVKDLGKCPPNNGQKHQIMDFNTPVYTGSNGTCAKYAWATKCGVNWDGITYGLLSNPCANVTNTTS